MPTVNLGRVKPINKGVYSGATAYVPLDMVQYNGNVYLCNANSTGNLPTSTAHFSPLVDVATWSSLLPSPGKIPLAEASGRLNDAWIQRKPDITPNLSVDWTKKPTAAALTAAGWTVTRASDMTYFGAIPVKVAENLFFQSENFSLSANWGRNACAVTAKTHSTGLSGFTLVANSGSAAPKIFQNFGPSNLGIGNYKVRFLLAAGAYTKAIISMGNGRGAAAFDLTGGGSLLNTGTGATAALPGGAAGSAGAGYVGASITPHELGGGLFWCEVETTPPAVGNGWWPGVIGYPDTGATLDANLGASYIGDGASGIEVYAAQIQHNFDGDYVPTTASPVTQYAAPLRVAAANELAYQHNSRGECLGLLQYHSATNLALQSQNLTDSTWGRYTVSVATVKRKWAGYAPFTRIAKTGTNTGAALSIVFTPSVLADTKYTATCALLGDRASATTSASVQLTLTEDWAGLLADFSAAILSGPGTLQFTTGCIVRVIGLSFDEPTVVRITRRYAISGTGPRFQICPGGDASTTVGAAVLATRVQVEAGARATPYIHTTNTTVTRASQSVTLDGSAFSAVSNPVEGTLLVRASVEDLVFDINRTVLRADFSGSESFRELLAVQAGTGVSYSNTTTAGVGQATQLSSTAYSSAPLTSAYSYSTNNFQLAVQGTVMAADTVGSLPPVNQITSFTAAAFCGLYQRWELYPRAMTSTELAAITTPGVLV